MEHLGLLLTGIAVVMTVLAALWGACVIMGLAFRERPAPGAAAPVEEEPPHEGIPAHHIAVISAAVAEMTPGAFRILNVRAPALIATAWAESNRFQQASSSRVRWDWASPFKPGVQSASTLTQAESSVQTATPPSGHTVAEPRVILPKTDSSQN